MVDRELDPRGAVAVVGHHPVRPPGSRGPLGRSRGERSADVERETLTYEDFGRAARELAQQVADSGYEPDIILSIARGGLFLGGRWATRST